MTNNPEKPTRRALLLAYLRLCRLPNAFTAMADVGMGYLFVRRSLDPLAAFLFLLAASCSLYTAGVVLNDVYDIDTDRRQRPFRPLPAGQVSLGWAKWLGYEVLLLGVALAWLAGYLYPAETAIPWRSGAVATVLAVCVVLYDACLKKTRVGPLGMGACRFLNVLLGMSTAQHVAPAGAGALGYDLSELIVAAGIGVYIVGVTWFARSEAQTSNPVSLLFGIVVMLVGIGLLASYEDFGGGASRMAIRPAFLWPLLLLLLSLTIVRRCLSAVINPQPERVQAAVKQCILSLIILDASVCLAVMPNEPYWAIGVLALLVPTLVLGRWVYST